MILDDHLDGTRLQRFAPDLGLFVTWNGGPEATVHEYGQTFCRAVAVIDLTPPEYPAGLPAGDFTFDDAVRAIDNHFAALRRSLVPA
jgi:hypothetical protein